MTEPTRAPGDRPARMIGGRYRIEDVVGTGAMGTVWRGYDTRLRRPVAVKEVNLPTTATDDQRTVMTRRAMSEARHAAKVSHPNIVAVHDVVADRGLPCLVMRLVEGRSLGDVVRATGPVGVARAAEIGIALVDALAAAHRGGVVHRDVKPSNVLLTDDGEVLLTDFSIATDAFRGTLSAGSGALGSPGYIAPERLNGHQTGPEADLFGLGATLFCAVEGFGPFDRHDPLAALLATATNPHPTPKRAGALAPVLDALLNKDPAERPELAEVRAALVAAARENAESAGAVGAGAVGAGAVGSGAGGPGVGSPAAGGAGASGAGFSGAGFSGAGAGGVGAVGVGAGSASGVGARDDGSAAASFAVSGASENAPDESPTVAAVGGSAAVGAPGGPGDPGAPGSGSGWAGSAPGARTGASDAGSGATEAGSEAPGSGVPGSGASRPGAPRPGAPRPGVPAHAAPRRGRRLRTLLVAMAVVICAAVVLTAVVLNHGDGTENAPITATASLAAPAPSVSDTSASPAAGSPSPSATASPSPTPSASSSPSKSAEPSQSESPDPVGEVTGAEVSISQSSYLGSCANPVTVTVSLSVTVSDSPTDVRYTIAQAPGDSEVAGGAGTVSAGDTTFETSETVDLDFSQGSRTYAVQVTVESPTRFLPVPAQIRALCVG